MGNIESLGAANVFLVTKLSREKRGQGASDWDYVVDINDVIKMYVSREEMMAFLKKRYACSAVDRNK